MAGKKKQSKRRLPPFKVILGTIVTAIIIISVWSVFIVVPYSLFYTPSIDGILPIQMKMSLPLFGEIGVSGTCFVVARRGEWQYAITAKHCITETTDIIVGEYAAEVVRTDSQMDIALIRFKSPEQHRIYEFASAEVGEKCQVVGWSGDTRLIYPGYVVATDLKGFVVSNGGAFPGCSGGILLNDDNKVIGITVGIARHGFSALDGTVMCVPARYAEAMVVTIGE